MEQAERSFPVSKHMMLNVLYDTLEHLGIPVSSSNSEHGRLRFLTENGAELILKIDTVYPQETVRVTIAAGSGEIDRDFADALFDEINSTIAANKAAL